jgi:hypothetical protein
VVTLTKLSLIFLQVAAAAVVDSAADLEAADSVAATATVAAAVVVADTVAETATVAEAMAAAVEVDSVVETAEAAAAEAVVAAEAVTTVIKMVTSHVNAQNKGKSATKPSPPPRGYNPDLQRGWYPYWYPYFEPLLKLLRNLCMINAGYYLYPTLLHSTAKSFPQYTYNVLPPLYQCIFVKILTITWFTS